MTKPNINVTPLIDVLLVLLIIFMVVSPLKPTNFKTKIPQKTDENSQNVKPHPHTLIVTLDHDSFIKLNDIGRFGTIDDPQKLIAKLKNIFLERKENRAYSEAAVLNGSLSEEDKVEKTVFIKASKKIDYGSVAKVIDAVKISGANPISLQIDDLEN